MQRNAAGAAWVMLVPNALLGACCGWYVNIIGGSPIGGLLAGAMVGIASGAIGLLGARFGVSLAQRSARPSWVRSLLLSTAGAAIGLLVLPWVFSFVLFGANGWFAMLVATIVVGVPNLIVALVAQTIAIWPTVPRATPAAPESGAVPPPEA